MSKNRRRLVLSVASVALLLLLPINAYADSTDMVDSDKITQSDFHLGSELGGPPEERSTMVGTKVPDGPLAGTLAIHDVPADSAKWNDLSKEDRELVDCFALSAVQPNQDAINGLPCPSKVKALFSGSTTEGLAKQEKIVDSVIYRWPCLHIIQIGAANLFPQKSTDSGPLRQGQSPQTVQHQPY